MAEDRNLDSERIGDYDSKLEYLYHNYEPDKKIPWVRYILLYLVLLAGAVMLIMQAFNRVPVKGKAAYEEPVIIDKMGYFTDYSRLYEQLDILENKIGYPVMVLSMPIDEYEVETADKVYYVKDYYHDYINDENHVLILVTYTGRYYNVELRCGDNVSRVFEDISVSKIIKSRITSEKSVSSAFVMGLVDINSKVMKLSTTFYAFFFGGIALIAATVVHAYIFIVRRKRKEKEHHE